MALCSRGGDDDRQTQEEKNRTFEAKKNVYENHEFCVVRPTFGRTTGLPDFSR
jgi:hypothetical protein